MPREILTFLCVGAAATLAHVVMAIALAGTFDVAPQSANLGGYVFAIGLSYLGHGRLTFRVDTNHKRHLPKFVTVSLVGLAIGSLLVEVLNVRMGLWFPFTMVCVGGAAASTSFILSKFWAFAKP